MGRAPCCEDHSKTGGGLKKGAWTTEEDEKLVSFIERNHGHHGSWRTLPHLAGLQRCGKSCRLRWTNYLRPNIKRGNFTADEERVIIQLHALVGNKWSNIASHLPGRTDNEVKNHWNTHLKKHLSRMGIDPVTHLPISDIVIHLKNHKTPPQALNSQLYVNQNMRTFLSPSPNSNWNSRPYVITQPFPMPWLDQNHMAQWECARLEAEARLAAMSSCEVHRISSSIQNTRSSLDNQEASYNYGNTSASDHSQKILSSLIELPDLSVPVSAATKQFDHNNNENLQNLLILPVVSSSNSTSSASSCMSDQFEFITHEPLLLSPACETCSGFDCGTMPTTTLSVPMASSGARPDIMIPAALPHDDLQSASVCDLSAQANNYWARMLNLVGPVSTSSICSSCA